MITRTSSLGWAPGRLNAGPAAAAGAARAVHNAEVEISAAEAQGAVGVQYLYAGEPPPAVLGATPAHFDGADGGGAAPGSAVGTLAAPALVVGGAPIGALTASGSAAGALAEPGSAAGQRGLGGGAAAAPPTPVTVRDEYLSPPPSSFAAALPSGTAGLPAGVDVAPRTATAGEGLVQTQPGVPAVGGARAALASPKVSAEAGGAPGGGSKLAQRLNNLQARGEGLLQSLAQGLSGSGSGGSGGGDGGGGTPERSAGSGARLGQARPASGDSAGLCPQETG